MLIHSTERPDAGVGALLKAYGYRPGEIDLAVDSRDPMFHFTLDERFGSRQVALFTFFQTAYTAFRLLQDVVQCRFGERRDLRILDFAGGYGRLTRFLVHHFGTEAVTIADIDPEAVAFQRERFGVRGIVSTTEPDELPLDAQTDESDGFDVIFVASLFSHLPRHRFEGWLRRLVGMMAPGGVILLSVHDEVALLPGRTMPEEGFYFEALSESDSLDRAEYGSAWITERYFRQAVARAAEGILEESLHAQRIPGGLWHWQDVYILTSGAPLEVSGGTVGRGVQGYLETCTLEHSGALRLGGWVVDHDRPGPVDELVITVGEEEAVRLQPRRSRPPVVEFLGGEAAFLQCGWEVTLPPSVRPFEGGDLLQITAQGRRGPSVLHAGNLEPTLLYTNMDRDGQTRLLLRKQEERHRRILEEVQTLAGDLGRRVDELEAEVRGLGYQRWELQQRIAAMEASRFWKLRNAWFRLTGRLP